VIRRLNECRNDQSIATLQSLDPEDQSLGRTSKRVIKFLTSSLITTGGIALSDSDKAEALDDSLETHFRPVTDLAVPAFIEMVDVALRTYFLTPASENNLTTPDEVQEAIRCFKVSKAPDTNRYPKQGLEASSSASGFPSGRS
jgi:hypothetical protein